MNQSVGLDRNPLLEEYYMRQALHVAEEALKLGEVPVGCVIVLRDATKYITPLNEDISATTNSWETTSTPSVTVSHGANQVNATRDATRHAEIVAVDRMITGGIASDALRLPHSVMAKVARGKLPNDCPYGDHIDRVQENDIFDKWVNVKNDANHWRNSFGWGSKRIFSQDIFSNCDLYVTCEPCIMVRTELAKCNLHYFQLALVHSFHPSI